MTRSARLLPALALLTILSVPSWAAPVEVAGIPNFHQVNDLVFRGAQPTDEAWPGLARLGVRTVVDLRRESEHSLAAESLAVEAAGMRYVSIPMNGFDVPRADQIAQVIDVLDSGTPVFVHCKLGCDRTGTVIAAYRIAHDGWDNTKALDEALTYGMHWYSGGLKRFIRDYQLAAKHEADPAAGPLPAAPQATQR
jgi:protein tyrosine/serine phosphatase